MKTPRLPDPGAPEATPSPKRWGDEAAGEGEEARFGALVRAGRRPAPLSASELASVWTRLDDAGPRPARRWAWQLAAALLVLLGGGALVAAKTQLFRWLPSLGAPPAPPPRPDRSQSAPQRRPKPSAETEVVVPPSPAAPPPPTVRKSEPRLAWRESPRSGVKPSPPVEPAPAAAPTTTPPPFDDGGPIQPAERARAVPSALAEESKLLGSALQALRSAHDPGAALALLDERRARFPAGALGAEADLTRIEALLQLDRRAEALAQLDPLRAPWTGRRRELLVARGELRADAGRCAEALVDFGVVVNDGGPRDSVFERALYGRAGCRARRGDGAGAHADLERYVAEFPDGRFGADARAQLRREAR